jgi:methylated-DNA-protein-cysteine methyltransferase related protein
MTDLVDRVREVVAAIPRGRVMTYGDLGHVVGTGARVVGRMLHAGGHDVPWWRVVSADGRPYPGAAADARSRYLDEATPLVDDGDDVRVDLRRASWSPQN